MNNLNVRGFTLVELLATIVILGIISVIAVVSVDKMLDHSREVECDSILVNIKNAAKEMVSDKRYNLVNTNDIYVNVDTLTEEGYLVSSMTNPFNNKPVTPSQKENIYAQVILNLDYTVKNVVIVYFNGVEEARTIKCHLEKDENVAVLFPGEE